MKLVVAMCLAFVALPIVVGHAQQPATGDSPKRFEHGHELFNYWRGTCHGSGPAYGGTTALAFKYQHSKPALLEDRTDLTHSEIVFYVRHGISVMPFFRKTELNDDELASVADYLTRNAAE